jgi:hypothetical protein
MNRDDSNGEIRKRFEGTREYYDSLTPSFSELLAQPRRSRRFHWAPRKALLFVSGLVIVVSIWAVAYLRPRPMEFDVSSLSNRRFPTDFLLQTPGSELLKTTPTIPSVSDFTNLQKLETPPRSVQ